MEQIFLILLAIVLICLPICLAIQYSSRDQSIDTWYVYDKKMSNKDFLKYEVVN